jgi:hypothetical protein
VPLGGNVVIELPLEAEPEDHDTIDAWPEPTPRLHVSPDGRFAAVVHDHGVTGVVVDLSTGESTMELDRGYDDTETTPFPIAFVTLDGRTILCHATTSYDIAFSNPATGESRTPEVQPTSDLYHGRPAVSPTGRRIADDGWVPGGRSHRVGSARRPGGRTALLPRPVEGRNVLGRRRPAGDQRHRQQPRRHARRRPDLRRGGPAGDHLVRRAARVVLRRLSAAVLGLAARPGDLGSHHRRADRQRAPDSRLPGRGTVSSPLSRTAS